MKPLPNNFNSIFDRTEAKSKNEIKIITTNVITRAAGILGHRLPGLHKSPFLDIQGWDFPSKDNARINGSVRLDVTRKPFHITRRKRRSVFFLNGNNMIRERPG